MKVLLLAPKSARGGGELPDYRAELANRIEATGHRGVVLEQEPGQAGETLRAKFLRLAGECDQAVLVWPEGAAMATTADELVLLQEAHDQHPMEMALILHESEVDVRSHELHVHSPTDQSRYLDGILACKPFILVWPRQTRFEDAAAKYTGSFL